MSISFTKTCKNADVSWTYINDTIIWNDIKFDFNNPSYFYIYFLEVSKNFF
jgi:hypothetical protein